MGEASAIQPRSASAPYIVHGKIAFEGKLATSSITTDPQVLSRTVMRSRHVQWAAHTKQTWRRNEVAMAEMVCAESGGRITSIRTSIRFRKPTNRISDWRAIEQTMVIHIVPSAPFAHRLVDGEGQSRTNQPDLTAGALPVRPKADLGLGR